jgi:primosomal protein N' (replication factor Y) (superfamily II helicase)
VTTDSGECAEVLLDLPTTIADGTLTYRTPKALGGMVCAGVRAVVPLGPRSVRGYIMQVHPCRDIGGRPIREILEVLDPAPLFSARLASLARWVARETVSSLREAVRCLIPPEVARRRVPARRAEVARLDRRDGLPGRIGRRQAQILAALEGARDGVAVTELIRIGGREALRRLVALGVIRVEAAPPPPPRGPAPPEDRAAHAGAPRPDVDERATLVWGDAEARLAWIVDAARTTVRQGRQVLVIVPEIALTPLLVGRFRAAFGDTVAAYHSSLPPTIRRELWQQIRDGTLEVVVGARGALFAPLDRLGLIVVDEEQDPSLTADASPRYHSRGVARERARLEGVRVVLGSAAPSLETYAAVLSGDLMCLRLPPAHPAPRITVVDMRTARPQGRTGILSPPLVEAMRRHVRAGGRVALFVNRVGYARVLLCHECGHAVRCARCDVSMAYDKETGTIQCRVCGGAAAAPEVCPRCKGVALHWVGPGTKRIEEVVHRLFPRLQIARLDRETASAFPAIADEFAAGRTRVLVGTQLLLRARQLRPSLIGVIDADHPLHLPDFRAAERAFQQWRAVVSLATAAPGPEAVVQTRVPDHPALAALRSCEDERFYDSELAVRREFGFPPYASLARLTASSSDRRAAHALAVRAAEVARASGVEVLGPAPALGRGLGRRGQFHVQCLLRALQEEAVRAAAREALVRLSRSRSARLVVEMDPEEISAW